MRVPQPLNLTHLEHTPLLGTFPHQELPRAVDYPLSALIFGDDLTLVFLAGEVVVDYSLALKRELKAHHPWLVGYAYEVPCYIPSERILIEGGYEAEGSLIYYGFYGPLKPETEGLIRDRVGRLVEQVKKSRR